MIALRTATPADAASLLHIYAPYVLETAVSFEYALPTIADMAARVEKYSAKFPWLICFVNGRPLGYAYATPHRDREAYQWTAECSIYLDDAYKGLGIGMGLYEVLFQILRMQGIRNVYAGITLPNHASVRLHEKCGFRNFATFENIGYKLGRWHNVGWWQLTLGNHEHEPPPPVAFPLLDAQAYSAWMRAASERIAQRING